RAYSRFMSTEDVSQNGSVLIQIDRGAYRVRAEALRGEELRQLPNPPISGEYDVFLFEEAGEPDRVVSDDETLTPREGMRFFTAPRSIRAGSTRRRVRRCAEPRGLSL